VVGHLDAGLDAGVSDGLQVLELWRYPVKSLLGERLERAEVGPAGLPGDRGWALVDSDSGEVLTARRVPDMLFATGRLRPDGGVEVVLPDGTVTSDDAALSAWTGHRVALRPAVDGAFHDEGADARLTLVSTGTLGGWDRRRFRPNVVLAGDGEDALVGSRVGLGTAVLDVGMRVPRCVMTTRPQAGGIGRDTTVLTTVHRERGGELAVGARVTRSGGVAVGDVLTRV
jgi:uncharacterized protein YcbX